MILHDVIIYGSSEKQHVHIKNGIIQTITCDRTLLSKVKASIRLEFNGAIILPGFINSHDHLDFNSFPRLGNRVYNNYTEWGKDIHFSNKEVIKEVQKIPQHLRIQWGMYKNLINGFTTVINHGNKLKADNSLVNIFQECYSLHSPAFEKYWALKLNNPLRREKPVVMHLGEGTDMMACKEIDSVIRSNLSNKRIIAVHGVGLNEKQASCFEGLIWCPDSNFFLLGKTSAIDKLKGRLPIVFGTDSTLTADWHGANHFEKALGGGLVTENELLDMLTVVPAKLWDLQDRGTIAEGMRADIIVLRGEEIFLKNIFTEISMIINNGEIRLANYIIKQQLNTKSDFDEVTINEKRIFVKAGLKKLTKDILSYYSKAVIPFELL
jgi:cytosine/adenosine deaminase-related metal-dependent hydrolase